MKLEHIKNAVTSKVGRQVLIGKKHSPTLLFAGGVVGVVATTVLACKATLKLEEVLHEAEVDREKANSLKHHKNYTEDDRLRDHKIITFRAAGKVARLYAPAVGVGIISVTALTGSHVILNRRNTALMAAYSALDKGFNEYRARVREEFGEDKEMELRHGTETVAETIVDKDGKPKQVERKVAAGMPSIYARFFDEQSREWQKEPEYNQVFLNCQQQYANDLLYARGHVFLNEVYDRLGFERTKAGAMVGWVKGNGDNFIDFGIHDGDTAAGRKFVNRNERSVLLDFNVDGVILDLI